MRANTSSDSSMASTSLGTDYILSALVAEGLRHLFLVPGGLVDPFLPTLRAKGRSPPPSVCSARGPTGASP